MRALRISAAVALAAGLATAAAAQEAGSRQTRDFVQAAAESDGFEIMEAYSALAESRDPQVRAFAERMIHDHGQTSTALQQAATDVGLKPPMLAVGAAQAPLLAALQSSRGHDFDQMYWRHQVLAHRSALVTEQRYAASGDVPAIRQVAASAVPVIEGHLTMAETMVAQQGG